LGVTPQPHAKTIRYALPAVVVALIIGLAAGFHTLTQRQLDSWKLLPQPERLTELFFSNPNALPTTYVPGANQSVAFTIHNMESHAERYRYTITEAASPQQRGRLLKAGVLVVRQGSHRERLDQVILRRLAKRVLVTVSLPEQRLAIAYWVTAK
jgi:hypothetical protein